MTIFYSQVTEHHLEVEMITRSTLLSGFCVIAAAAALTGCGNDAGTVVTGPSGRLSQGPVLGATVFADQVSAGVRFSQDSNEVNTVTDASTGDFTLPTVPGYNYILVSKGGHDKLTGLPAIQMLAPAGAANITPLTTLVALDTTGTVKAKLETLMPGFTYDADVSTSASQAVLLVTKSVETMVAAMSASVTSAPGAPAISATQVTDIQLLTMRAIAAQFAAVPAATLLSPSALTNALQSAGSAAATSINAANPNIHIPPSTGSSIATASVSASVTAIGITGSTASTTAIVGGESAALANTAAGLATATTLAGTTAAATVTATPTPDNYVPPTITVVTPPTVGGTTGATGGNTGGTGQSF
jgi:hypothetical protein